MALKGTTVGEQIYNFLLDMCGGNHFGASGLWGNVKAESNHIANNLQNTYNTKLGMTDAQYTAAVDNGTYKNFVYDSAGYGICQWTYWSRKQAMYDFIVVGRKASIGDLESQLEFLKHELSTSYKAVLAVLKSAKSVREASNVVLAQFEKPAGWNTIATQDKRAGYGEEAYNLYANKSGQTTSKEVTTVARYASKVIEVAIGEIGYKEKATNANLQDKTANAGSKDWTKYANDFDTKYPNWYNGKKNGYAWCDMFVDWCFLTAYGYQAALDLLCQPEKSAGAGCTYSYAYYKKKGQVGTTPKVGAQIFFGYSESNLTHTGIVEKFDANYVYTIEGNTSNQVARRTYARTAGNIFGYGYPAYDGEGTVSNSTPASSNTSKTVTEIANEVIAGMWGNGADRKSRLEAAGYNYSTVQAEVNRIVNGTSTSTSAPAATTSGGEVRATAAAHFYDKDLAGTYKTTTDLHIRNDAGTSKSSLGIIPSGTNVKNYGYYNKDTNGKVWLYIQVTINGIKYTGFSSSEYLKK